MIISQELQDEIFDIPFAKSATSSNDDEVYDSETFKEKQAATFDDKVKMLWEEPYKPLNNAFATAPHPTPIEIDPVKPTNSARIQQMYIELSKRLMWLQRSRRLKYLHYVHDKLIAKGWTQADANGVCQRLSQDCSILARQDERYEAYNQSPIEIPSNEVMAAIPDLEGL